VSLSLEVHATRRGNYGKVKEGFKGKEASRGKNPKEISPDNVSLNDTPCPF
jgi:hypothetical protein